MDKNYTKPYFNTREHLLHYENFQYFKYMYMYKQTILKSL